MSSIPSAINLNGLSQRTYQKTEVFDTPGNHTWTHPLPGQNIEVFVEMIGAAGGSVYSTNTGASDGGDTIWNTGGSPIIASGGLKANNVKPGGGFINGASDYAGRITLFGGIAGNPAVCAQSSVYTGGSGTPKTFNAIVNGDINLTVGAGGTTDNTGATHLTNNGQDGAIIISYNITTTQTPVVVNMQRRDWEHFGEISWRKALNTGDIAWNANTVTNLPIDTEILDTGNKVTVNGDDTFTLEAGTYEMEIILPGLPGNHTASGAIRLYNNSDSSIALSYYNPRFDSPSGNVSNHCIKGVVNIPQSKIFKLEVITAGDNISSYPGNAGSAFTSVELTDVVTISFKWRP
jgi:hypothetical protein